MLETILGGLLGGAFRLAPEVLKWLDRNGERKHELSMQDKALEFERVRGAQRTNEINASSAADWNKGTMDALIEAVSGQSKLSGVAWADALSASVRPIVTYLFMLLYCSAKYATFKAALVNGDIGAALLQSWTDADQALWASVLNFWFLGRVFEKVK